MGWQDAPPIADPNAPAPAWASAPETTPATWQDRVQAGKAGLLRGGTYLAGMIPDAVANTAKLGEAALGTVQGLVSQAQAPDAPAQTPGGLYHFLTADGTERYSKEPPPPGSKPVPTYGKAPSIDVGDANPVANALAGALDKVPGLSTQVNRPDDAVSRYIATGASVVPAVLAGGEGTVAARGISALKNVPRAAAPAAAGQYVAEAKPFGTDTAAGNIANDTAAALTQALGTAAMGRQSPGERPEASVVNQTVKDAQAGGFKIPPATTNPTPANRFIEATANKGAVQEGAQIHNQAQTNIAGRQDLGLTGTGPVTPKEVGDIKTAANAAYSAVRQAGTLPAPGKLFKADLDTAMSQFSGASKLSPSLATNELAPIVADLKGLKTFDTGHALDTIDMLREKSKAAYDSGDKAAGKAYKGVSNALEAQIDRSLAATPGGANLVPEYKAARTKLAILHSITDAQNSGSSNINAGLLAKALDNGQQLSPNLTVAARAAAVAPKAFIEPTSSKTTGHGLFSGGLLGTLIAAREMQEMLPEGYEHAGLAAPAAILAYKGVRSGAEKYALSGAGQRGAIQMQPEQLTVNQLAAALSSLAPNSQRRIDQQ